MTSVSDLIAPFEERWNQCEGLPEMTLLRLGILREVIKLLHSEKSRLLASGRRSEIQPVKDWESKIEQLRDQPALKGPLPELLASDKRAAKRTRLLPDHLFSFIPKERFERYDRIWESTLAAEACALGWRFFSLEAWVQIAAVEAFDRALTDQLWPHGLVLFTESAGTAPIREEDEPAWQGRWIAILHPTFKSPADLNLDPSRWAGTATAPPTPPVWKLLFSPKAR